TRRRCIHVCRASRSKRRARCCKSRHPLCVSSRVTATPDVVAVINTSPDVVDMLHLTLEDAGIVVVSALTWEVQDGEVDLERFITQHNPRVVVYDVAPPYENNWRLFLNIH